MLQLVYVKQLWYDCLLNYTITYNKMQSCPIKNKIRVLHVNYLWNVSMYLRPMHRESPKKTYSPTLITVAVCNSGMLADVFSFAKESSGFDEAK